jgi:hypothetical protein
MHQRCVQGLPPAVEAVDERSDQPGSSTITYDNLSLKRRGPRQADSGQPMVCLVTCVLGLPSTHRAHICCMARVGVKRPFVLYLRQLAAFSNAVQPYLTS